MRVYMGAPARSAEAANARGAPANDRGAEAGTWRDARDDVADAADAQLAGARAARAPRARSAAARRAEASAEETMAVGRVPEERADLGATALCGHALGTAILFAGARASVFGRGVVEGGQCGASVNGGSIAVGRGLCDRHSLKPDCRLDREHKKSQKKSH